MKELLAQIRDRCPACKAMTGPYFVPSTDEDSEIAKGYKLFQIVRLSVYGVKKVRSIKQMHTYWAACKFLSENNDQHQWNTKDKVDFQCRVATHFVDPDLVIVKPDGAVAFQYRSIAFKNLGHIEACRYFERAYDVMASFYNKINGTRFIGEDIVSLTVEWIKNK